MSASAQKNTAIQVKMLGDFSISDGAGHCILSDRNNRSRKVLLLLEYLLACRSRGVPQSELIEVLWPGDSSDKSGNTLKTLLHRARGALEGLDSGDGSDWILCRHGVYTWNSSRETVVDTEEFERLVKLSEHGTGSERLKAMRKALNLYRGDFLARASDEQWVIPRANCYHAMYLNVAHEALKLLEAEGRCDRIVELCRAAVAVEPCDEELHLHMIRALQRLGQPAAAMDHYCQVTELFLDKYGITPSGELTALYKELQSSAHARELNLNVIREELRESERVPGAFFCEYAFFKDIYRLEARAAPRGGGAVQLALLSLEDPESRLPQKQVALIMQRLRDVIGRSLRSSDVFSRYSVSQYILMLPGARLEDSKRALERIRKGFARTYPHMNAAFRISCLPMEPAEL